MTQSKLLGTIIATLAACALAFSGESKPENGAEKAALVKADEIEVTLVSEKKTIMLGEPVWLSFVVANKTDQEMYVVYGGDYRNALGRPDSFKVSVVDQNQKLVPQPSAGMGMGGRIGPRKIPAKGSYPFGLFLPHWATFETTGTYTITVQRDLEVGLGDAKDWGLHGGNSIPVRAETKIEIVAPDAEKMGALIEELGRELMTNDLDKAAKALLAIKDERTIPIFLKALETNNYSRRFNAISGLGKYNDDRALDGLKRSMKTTGADLAGTATRRDLEESSAAGLRHTTAAALSTSPHPGALPFLLTQRQDTSDGVRLTVVHALGKMKTAEATALLTEMTGDKSDMVSGEAKRYLREREGGK